MIQKINIVGTIISNDEKDVYDWVGWEGTCPSDIKNALQPAQPGDSIEVYINSPGGRVESGSEIYSILREAASSYDVKIYITGEACSAASVIACASYCEMAPTALMMIHCVSTKIEGNHSDMEKAAETLRTADKAICSAYMAKAGISEEEALAMMEQETWLTAEQAKEKGLIDAVMFDNEQDLSLVAGPISNMPSAETVEHLRAIMEEEKLQNKRRKDAATLRLETLKL